MYDMYFVHIFWLEILRINLALGWSFFNMIILSSPLQQVQQVH